MNKSDLPHWRLMCSVPGSACISSDECITRAHCVHFTCTCRPGYMTNKEGDDCFATQDSSTASGSAFFNLYSLFQDTINVKRNINISTLIACSYIEVSQSVKYTKVFIPRAKTDVTDFLFVRCVSCVKTQVLKSRI